MHFDISSILIGYSENVCCISMFCLIPATFSFGGATTTTTSSGFGGFGNTSTSTGFGGFGATATSTGKWGLTSETNDYIYSPLLNCRECLT